MAVAGGIPIPIPAQPLCCGGALLVRRRGRLYLLCAPRRSLGMSPTPRGNRPA